MACVNTDGTLTGPAREVLQLAGEPIGPESIAQSSGVPLYRVRASLRELVEAELLTDHEGAYTVTEAGRQRLESTG
jgi:predicted transcriptional regulator